MSREIQKPLTDEARLALFGASGFESLGLGPPEGDKWPLYEVGDLRFVVAVLRMDPANLEVTVSGAMDAIARTMALRHVCLHDPLRLSDATTEMFQVGDGLVLLVSSYVVRSKAGDEDTVQYVINREAQQKEIVQAVKSAVETAVDDLSGRRGFAPRGPMRM